MNPWLPKQQISLHQTMSKYCTANIELIQCDLLLTSLVTHTPESDILLYTAHTLLSAIAKIKHAQKWMKKKKQWHTTTYHSEPLPLNCLVFPVVLNLIRALKWFLLEVQNLNTAGFGYGFRLGVSWDLNAYKN